MNMVLVQESAAYRQSPAAGGKISRGKEGFAEGFASLLNAYSGIKSGGGLDSALTLVGSAISESSQSQQAAEAHRKEKPEKSTDKDDEHDRDSVLEQDYVKSDLRLDEMQVRSEAAGALQELKSAQAEVQTFKPQETFLKQEESSAFKSLTDFKTDVLSSKHSALDNSVKEASAFKSSQLSENLLKGTDAKLSARELLNTLAQEANVTRITVKNLNVKDALHSHGLQLENNAQFAQKSADLDFINENLSLKDSLQAQLIEEEKSTSATSMFNVEPKGKNTVSASNQQPFTSAVWQQRTASSLSQKGLNSEAASLKSTASSKLSHGAAAQSTEAVLKARNARFSANQSVMDNSAEKTDTVGVFKKMAFTAGSEVSFKPFFGTVQDFGAESSLSGLMSEIRQSSSLTTALNLLEPTLEQLSSLKGAGAALGSSMDFSQGRQGEGFNQTASSQAVHAALNMSPEIDDNAKQVSEMVMTMAARNLKSMVIDLNPASLGQMSINLTLNKSGTPLKVEVGAKNASTKALVAKMLPSLNRILEDSGFASRASLMKEVLAA